MAGKDIGQGDSGCSLVFPCVKGMGNAKSFGWSGSVCAGGELGWKKTLGLDTHVCESLPWMWHFR